MGETGDKSEGRISEDRKKAEFPSPKEKTETTTCLLLSREDPMFSGFEAVLPFVKTLQSDKTSEPGGVKGPWLGPDHL